MEEAVYTYADGNVWVHPERVFSYGSADFLMCESEINTFDTPDLLTFLYIDIIFFYILDNLESSFS